jgi:hypothetical protein
MCIFCGYVVSRLEFAIYAEIVLPGFLKIFYVSGISIKSRTLRILFANRVLIFIDTFPDFIQMPATRK